MLYAFVDDRALRNQSRATSSLGTPALCKLVTTTISKRSLLCLARDPHGRFVTTLPVRADVDEPATHADITDRIELPIQTLRNLLRDRPDALLIDVRDPCEHSFANFSIADVHILNIPMSRLAGYFSHWLRADERRPLIFFCRSGTRGRSAVETLRHLGYAKAWNLAGDIARGPSDTFPPCAGPALHSPPDLARSKGLRLASLPPFASHSASTSIQRRAG